MTIHVSKALCQAGTKNGHILIKIYFAFIYFYVYFEVARFMIKLVIFIFIYYFFIGLISFNVTIHFIVGIKMHCRLKLLNPEFVSKFDEEILNASNL